MLHFKLILSTTVLLLLENACTSLIIVSSPVGYPGRAVKTNLIQTLEPNTKKIQCISNCIFPCGRGKGARAVGYCIADSLGDAYLGRLQSGLFFSGANGWKLKEIVHVKDLIDELMTEID